MFLRGCVMGKPPPPILMRVPGFSLKRNGLMCVHLAELIRPVLHLQPLFGIAISFSGPPFFFFFSFSGCFQFFVVS